MLYGPKGVGKSHALAAFMMGSGVHPHYCRLVSVAQMFADMRRHMNNPDHKVIDLRNASLVGFDDLGKERMTPWVAEQFFLMIDDLYSREVSIMIATNLGASLEHHVGEFVWDRFKEMLVPTPMRGESRRGQSPARQGSQGGTGDRGSAAGGRLRRYQDAPVRGDEMGGGPGAQCSEPAPGDQARGELAPASMDSPGGGGLPGGEGPGRHLSLVAGALAGELTV